MSIVDDFKNLPPAWLGAIAGAVAAGAALFPDNRIAGGLGAGALVFFIARKATKPCCAECESASSGAAPVQQQAAVTAQEALTEQLDAGASDLFAESFVSGSPTVTTSGAAAGGDLFPDSAAGVLGTCRGCSSGSLVKEPTAPAYTLAVGEVSSPIGTSAPIVRESSKTFSLATARASWLGTGL